MELEVHYWRLIKVPYRHKHAPRLVDRVSVHLPRSRQPLRRLTNTATHSP